MLEKFFNGLKEFLRGYSEGSSSSYNEEDDCTFNLLEGLELGNDIETPFEAKQRRATYHWLHPED